VIRNSRVVQGNQATVSVQVQPSGARCSLAVPPAARVFFKIDKGMRPIPLYKAASALGSVVPIYQQTP
jgi:hypothetical protein